MMRRYLMPSSERSELTIDQISLSELTIDQISLKVATHGRQWEQNPQLVRACVGR